MNKALKRVVNLKNNINKILTWIRSWLPEASSDRTWIRQGISYRESTDRPTPPPNSFLTLYLTISIYNTRSYGELIFSWLLALILKIWIRVSGMALGRRVGGVVYRGDGVGGKALPCHWSTPTPLITIGWTDIKGQHRCNIGGSRELTFEVETDRRGP
jgi:hypothetical protein